eukprot:1857881-Rhodomonas_salina.1
MHPPPLSPSRTAARLTLVSRSSSTLPSSASRRSNQACSAVMTTGVPPCRRIHSPPPSARCRSAKGGRWGCRKAPPRSKPVEKTDRALAVDIAARFEQQLCHLAPLSALLSNRNRLGAKEPVSGSETGSRTGGAVGGMPPAHRRQRCSSCSGLPYRSG